MHTASTGRARSCRAPSSPHATRRGPGRRSSAPNPDSVTNGEPGRCCLDPSLVPRCLQTSRRCSLGACRRKEPGAGHESGPRLPASAASVGLHVDAVAGADSRRSPWCGGSRHRRRTGAGGGGQTDHVSARHRCDEQHQRRKDEPCLPRGVANRSLCLHVDSPLDPASRLGRSVIHTPYGARNRLAMSGSGARLACAPVRRGSTSGWARRGRTRRTSPCGPSGAGGVPDPHQTPRCG